ncbi:TRAP dicarboxylate transporter subunit DctQ [Nitratireductor indicus C115]|uniref:TRAP transporter small permease protein n=1 Tax=Nitratireductor indicus C115 TaxID=1231190 RepID=K2MXP3_9HYPH|nr:TRAP transporter small permease subunit [Nitratireductor indicus]EKF40013.1 TRAP dicarboxylate transporter subunit DctQ [Nitratireductor indicus C115]SFQ79942.1 TRAP-type C4-dicarboxylate transport system, small permease component [Nitratireductor indicus]
MKSRIETAAPGDDILPGPETEARLTRVSRLVARFEAVAAGVLIFSVFAVLMANVVSRALSRPLIWSDELAINLMIWSALIGASLGIAHRQHIAVTLLPNAVRPSLAHAMGIVVDLTMLAFFATLALLLWRWFDLPGLIAAGSVEAHSAATFNFIWQEPTVTLGVRKVWFWLVLPIFCLTGSLHVVASLAARLTSRKGVAL